MAMSAYDHIADGGFGFIEQPRALINVSGTEAVQFLDGMITNDVKTLEDGAEMLAAFPNAQGRLLALVRVLRRGETFFIETEQATHETLYNNLFRFTFAGDFIVEDVSDHYKYFEFFGTGDNVLTTGAVRFSTGRSIGVFVPIDSADGFAQALAHASTVGITEDDHEILRIEAGIVKYGVDMDETTIIPELGLDGMISYNKGCYIGQEIIARIHFRGHVAKQLTGLVLSGPGAIATGSVPVTELTTADGKNAGRITSTAFSPKLGGPIALAFVRYDFLQHGTKLFAGDQTAVVSPLFFERSISIA
jgi:folate-binding protein YgfZ